MRIVGCGALTPGAAPVFSAWRRSQTFVAERWVMLRFRFFPVPITAAVATAILGVASAAAVTAAPNVAADALAANAEADHWVATWTSMPQLTEPSNMPPPPFTQGSQVMADTTLRQTIRITVGGSRFRLHLNNVFGGAVLPITAASVALPAGGMAGASGIQPGTAQPVTFGGQPSITVPVGAEAISDPLDKTVPSGANLTVTLYLASGQSSGSITSHPGSRTTSYLVRGNHLNDTTLSNATAVDHWYFVSGLDVSASADTGAVVVLGDSLTDGRGSTTNGNDRWPDKMFERLQQQSATADVAVANQAAGGNAVLSGGLGPTALQRFDRDVLGQSGVKWLIVFEGVNDLGSRGSPSTANDLIAAYRTFITRAHAAGIEAYGATITPFGGSGHDDDAGAHEAARQTVNSWIRTSNAFDAVLDFDQVVRDPSNPRRIRPAYDTGDHLHLNQAGYAALGAAVPTSLFDTPVVPTSPVPPSSTPPTSSTASSPAQGGCSASYQVANSWNGGFVAGVDVTAGSALIRGWRVTLNLPSGTAVSNGWNAMFTGTRGTVTASNTTYNGTLTPGASASFGFQGTGSGSAVTVSCAAA
ncbi:GDSL-type esterase/lipase family protein [Plantactinospora sp. CA-294935]|uniref:GDSL-type esterase/lipase family protein n=1 Tax=Plantactinospora sp. CA-294935 TaxID=3240012 RepID=UPI003D8B2017